MPDADKIRRMTGELYLAQVEPAARHLYEGIAPYLKPYRQHQWPSEWRKRTREEWALRLKEIEASFAGEFSLAVLCGAILQIAAQGIEMCSTNQTIPSSCAAFATTETARYCVGRDVHGLPLGAIVVAGRHQFAHWYDEQSPSDKRNSGFSRFVEGVFGHLCHVHLNDPWMDLVYDLGNHFYQGSAIRANSLVLSEMGWTIYDFYVRDMQDMLGLANTEVV